MTPELILQGLTARTHADLLGEMLALADIERIIISVAFVSERGVQLIEKRLKPHAAKTEVFAGIRNDITSAQALRRLLDIGVSLHAVDTGSRLLLFHPKLYLVRGKSEASLSVGSANLTVGGLNNNVEAGLVLRLDPGSVADADFLTALEKQFDALAGAHPKNVLAVDQALIADLLASGRVVDERALPPPRAATTAKPGSSDPTPRMRLKAPSMRRLPIEAAKPARPVQAGGPALPPIVAPTTGVDYELVWVSKKLEERDLNIPTGKTTSRTGSINLDKGLMEAGVDHRHYFREVVFSELNWPKISSQVDTAEALFAIVIKGINRGTYRLVVRHTTSTTSVSYRQKNAMTRISWGPATKLVRNKSLRNRHLALYRDRGDPTHFLIEID